MGLDQHAGYQAQQGGGLGKDPDDVGSAFDLLAQPLHNGLVDHTLTRCASGKSANAGISWHASRSIVATVGN